MAFCENFAVKRGSDVAEAAVVWIWKKTMKYFLLLVAALGIAGCATDSQGRKESAWEAMKRWDDSMDNTIDRLQAKNYQE